MVLPYNSTLRLFIGSGSRNPLGLHKGGEPATYWSISPNDTNTYYLSGTLTVVTANNGTLTVTPGNYAGSHEYHDWRGTLTFPKVKITATP